MPLLDIAGLHVDFPSHQGVLHAVDDLSLQLEAGEVLGIVGESGSGKSVTALSAMRLLPQANSRTEGEILFGGHNLLTLAVNFDWMFLEPSKWCGRAIDERPLWRPSDPQERRVTEQPLCERLDLERNCLVKNVDVDTDDCAAHQSDACVSPIEPQLEFKFRGRAPAAISPAREVVPVTPATQPRLLCMRLDRNDPVAAVRKSLTVSPHERMRIARAI